MKILGIIPARGGSKGVPGKNIKLLGDKPLIAYTIEQALQSSLLAKVIVSTDDEKIMETVMQLGAEVPFKRPAELANDTASSIAVVQHAVDFLESEGDFFDAICLLQPTSPFRENGFIDQAIEDFAQKNADALISVLPVPQELNPHWIFEKDASGFLNIATGEKEIITRRQDLPLAFFRDGAVYLTKIDAIKAGSFYGKKLISIQSNPELYINIDTIDDWHEAEKILPKYLNQR
ncbi:cytidylyltransferase domain-containing protein [Flavobacterium sp. 3HN19-14]|uniref:acylneuraminate cytidylyltransferase family protein n=1 Tax=Flavobacterium sp. 3HN19-14 TaxID=3448133 RepID=UPI003EDFBD8D